MSQELIECLKEGSDLDAKIIENQKSVILIQEQIIEAQKKIIESLKSIKSWR